MNSRFDYTILDAINNAFRAVKASPLTLGATASGVGGPVGGYVGYLPQQRVSYDSTELATLDTPASGMSLVDNLNHIRAELDLKVPYTVLMDSKDPTGWVDPSSVTVSYDSTARTITLTGTLDYYWRGVKHSLTSPWTSSVHTATNGGWYLSSSDGESFTWSMTPWTFDAVMVAFVNYGATYKFALRETHGMMPWQAHETLHNTIGTWKESGGTLSSYTLSSTTAANRRPDVAATHLHDEDNETTNAALTSKLYNKLYLAGSTPTITYTGETADIVPLLVNNPYYNSFTTPNWGQTLMANNSYMCVWLVAIPTTADTASQTYRYTWIQGQSNGNLASQTALTPSDLNLEAFTTEATEFVFLAKIIIRYTGGNWDLNSVTILTGNRMIQVGSPAGAYLSSVATDATLTGDGSLASPLSVVGGGGGVTPVDPSVVGNLVSFADTTGGQADSGVPVAHVLLGTGWPFNFYRLLYTDAVGNVAESDRLVFDPTSDQISLGMNDGSNNANVRIGGNSGNAATPNTTSSFFRLIEYGTPSTSTNLFKGVSSRGTKAVPTASLANDLLAHFTGAGHKGSGNVEDNTSTGGMVVVANENQSATNRGTRTELYSTPNGTTAKVLGFTLNADGNVNIGSGKTYNINGSPHTHTAAGVAAIPNDGWIAITLGSPTRTATTTFTTTTDLTALWQKGFKLKFTDTTTKYAYVVAMSAYSAGSMTVTILGNALVGNPSAFSYSPIENPLGFPTSFSYTPTPTGITTTSGTLTGNFRISGNEILVRVTFAFGASSAITGNVSFAMPITPATMAGTTIPVGFGQYFDSSASAVNTGVISDVFGTFYAQCFNVAGTYAAVNNLSSTAPFTWATGDEITATITYAIF